MRLNFRRFKSSAGLTMIELIGGIAIIAALTSIVITTISGSFEASEIRAVQRQTQVFTSAYQSYIASGGFLADMDAMDQASTIAQARDAVDILMIPLATPFGQVGPFLPQSPTDDWFLSATELGKTIGGETYYIGFRSSLGFFMIEP